MSLRPLLEIAAEHERFRSLASAAREGRSVPVHMSASIQPYLLAALVEAPDGLGGRPVLVVAADDIGARDLARELRAYLAPRQVRYYPSRGTGYASHVAPPPHLVGLRIAALDAITASDPAVVVASAVALAEAVPDAALRPGGFTLERGAEVDLGEVADLLVEAGYEHVDQVDERGQFAVRGGILDVFGATEDRAARLELFGDEIESIRWFSTFTQRSLGEADRVEISPAAELASEHRELAELALEDDEERPDLAELLPLESFRAPLELIPTEAAVIITAAEEIETALRDHWDDVTTAIRDADARRLYVDVAAPLAERASLQIHGLAADPIAADPLAAEAEPSRQAEADLVFRAPAPASAARSMGEAESQLERELRSGNRVVVAFENRGEAERARYNLNRLDARFLDDQSLDHSSLGDPLAAEAKPSTRAAFVWFAEARLSDGFVSADLSLVVIPFRRLVHRRPAAAPGPARGRLATFTDLRVGDHVVHEDHGIARFAGFETKTVASVTRDYLELSYRGSDRVFAPTDQLAKITRYVGTGGEPPQLSALGSARWEGVKDSRPPRRSRAGGRAAQPLRGAPRSARPCLSARRRLAADPGAVLPVSGDDRPARGDRVA